MFLLDLLSLDTALFGSLPNLPVTIHSEAMNHFSTGDHSDISSSLNTVAVTLDIPSGIQTFRIALSDTLLVIPQVLPLALPSDNLLPVSIICSNLPDFKDTSLDT